MNSRVILSIAKELKGKCVGLSLVMMVCVFASLQAQQPIRLNLKRTIELANDSSLSAFRYQNMYLSGFRFKVKLGRRAALYERYSQYPDKYMF